MGWWGLERGVTQMFEYHTRDGRVFKWSGMSACVRTKCDDCNEGV